MRARILTVGAMSVAIAVATYVGWDAALWDPCLQLALHLAAAVAIGGVAVAAWRGSPMPRTPLDVPIACLLLVYGAATVAGENIGLSAPALAGIVATAAMLPVALLALRHRRDLTVLVAVMPILGLSLVALATLLWRRVEWLLAGGGWPPLRLANEATAFGSLAVPPFVILAAVPLALLATDPRRRRALVAALLALGLPLALLSGSRSAWIAIGVAAAVLIVPLAGSLRGRLRLSRTRLAAAAGGIGLAGLGLLLIGSRLTEATSLAYRQRLWEATLTVWRGDPWLGIGPGAMPYARQVVAPLVQPHSHDVPLGILGDAGIVGLIAAAALFAAFAWVARPRGGATDAGRVAHAAMAGIAAGFLTEDLTFLPNVNLVLVLLVAVALLEARAVSWRSLQWRPRLAAPLAFAATALLACGMVADAAAISFRAGTDAAAAADWRGAQAQLELAVALNPTHPTAPKALAVAAEANGDAALARRAAQDAVALNPGDWASWINLAVLCQAGGDPTCAVEAAGQALRASGRSGPSLVNAARIYARAGDTATADAAYRSSLLLHWETALVLAWPRPIPLGAATASERGPTAVELSLLVARRLQGEPLRPPAYAVASIRALAFGMAGDGPAARAAMADAIRQEPSDPITWDLIALLRRHWGEDDSSALRMGSVARGAPLDAATPRIPAITRDIAALRAYPADALVSGAQRLLTDQPWPWVLDPLLSP